MHANCFAFSLMLSLCVGSAYSASLPAGDYNCFLFLVTPPRATFVGEIAISGERYSVARQSTSGTYRFDTGSGKVVWRGKPPLGFEAGAFEIDPTSGRKQIRMYPKEADIGNKWKAALCTPKSGERASSASASAPGGAGKGSPFKAGDRVMAEFIGVPYPATVVSAEGPRVRLRYDDPASKDEWVDASRVKLRK